MTKHTVPEMTRSTHARVACDGTDNGALPAALGHPRVWLQIDPELGFVECGYCDRRFVLIGGVADHPADDPAHRL